jgi:hypothetical protein
VTLVVEDGTGKPDANSYASINTADTYHSDRGNVAWAAATGDKSAALIRATQYIEGKYRGRWPGVRLRFPSFIAASEVQALSWPRYGALDFEGFPILPNQIHAALVNATCEAALREVVSVGSLTPDLTSSNIKTERAGDTENEYFPGYGLPPHVTVIDGILAPILRPAPPRHGHRRHPRADPAYGQQHLRPHRAGLIALRHRRRSSP